MTIIGRFSSRRSIKTILVATLTLSSLTGFAEDPKSLGGDPKGWHGELMPYLWYAGLEGELDIGNREFDFDKSASDLFDAVDFAGSLMGGLQYDRYVLWGQGDYIRLSTDELDSTDQPDKVEFDSKVQIIEGAVGYQIDGWMPGQTFDLMIGGRTMHMENDLKLKRSGRKFDKERNVTDPMVFVRPSIPLFPSKTQKLRFNPTLGVGGGGDSEVVYELFPQIQYHFTEHIAGRIGYRTLGWKVEKGNNDLDVNMAGLVIGLGGTF